MKNYSHLEFWNRVANYYSSTVDIETLKLYAEDTQKVDVELLIAAFAEYRRNPAHLKMPIPAQLAKYLRQEISDESRAIECAHRIIATLNPVMWEIESAKEHVGELGRKVVELFGGWHVLGAVNQAEHSFLYNKIKSLALAVCEKSRYMATDQPPSLPKNNITSIKQLMDKYSQKPKEMH